MGKYDYLKKENSLYEKFDLECNPFSIAPLFKEFKDVKHCEQDEDLFFLNERLEKEVSILLKMENRRALVYGLYGVGKTSFVDFIIYMAHNFRRRFCVRAIVTEDNVVKAINEVLLSLCFEILSEIESRKITKPVESVRKWIASKKFSDLLMTSLSKLMGSYIESEEIINTKTKKRSIKASSGILSGDIGYEKEVVLRKTIQSYIEILPMRKVAEYLQDFSQIIQMLGFKDIIIFIDEADHLQQIDVFLKLLTRSREILFSKGYTFFIAGSIEIAKYTESLGAIFDKLILLKPASLEDMKTILEQRIKAYNPKKKLYEIFDEDSISLIYEKSKGIQKHFLRMAENSLDEAVMVGDHKVRSLYCLTVFQNTEDEVRIDLKDSQISILRFLARNDRASASDKKLQDETQVGRTYLRMVLEELVKKGYVKKEKNGRKVYYAISSQYKAYFKKV